MSLNHPRYYKQAAVRTWNWRVHDSSLVIRILLTCITREELLSFGINFDHFNQLLQSDKSKNTAIFVDEIYLRYKRDPQALTEIAKLCKGRTIWLTITAMDKHNVKPEEVEAAFAKLDFYIPELHNPIRNTSDIIKYAHPGIGIKGIYVTEFRVHNLKTCGVFSDV